MRYAFKRRLRARTGDRLGWKVPAVTCLRLLESSVNDSIKRCAVPAGTSTEILYKGLSCTRTCSLCSAKVPTLPRSMMQLLPSPLLVYICFPQAASMVQNICDVAGAPWLLPWLLSFTAVAAGHVSYPANP